MGPFRFRRKSSAAAAAAAPGRTVPALLPAHHIDVERIARDCRRLVTQRAMVSATASMVPLPGLDVLVDIGVLMRMLEEVNAAFGLTPMQIERLERERRFAVYRVLKGLGDSAVGRTITRDVLALVVKNVATRMASRWATKTTVRFVPLAGQVVAATLSFAAIKYLGERHIRDCMTVANQVIDLN
jgi:uncharacterized protein (DUF697 family)